MECYTKFHNSLFNNSNNNNVIIGTSTIRDDAVLVVLKRRIVYYEMASGDLLYLSVFMTISSEFQVVLKLISQEFARL